MSEQTEARTIKTIELTPDPRVLRRILVESVERWREKLGSIERLRALLDEKSMYFDLDEERAGRLGPRTLDFEDVEILQEGLDRLEASIEESIRIQTEGIAECNACLGREPGDLGHDW
jgi:hypothetical protein